MEAERPGFDEGDVGADDVVGGLTRWLAEARVDAAASSRARERWLRQQLADLVFAGQTFLLPAPPPAPR